MVALLRQLAGVCVFRRGPEDLPYSPRLTFAVAAALLAAQAIAATLLHAPPRLLFARVAVTLFVLAGLLPQLLRWRGFAARMPQTVLAYAGTSLFFSLALLPLALLFQPWAGAADPPRYLFFPGLVVVGLFLWKLRIDAAVLRSALELGRPMAQLLAVALFALQFVLQLVLAPPDVSPSP